MQVNGRLEGFDALAFKLRGLTDRKQIGKTLKQGVRSGMAEPLKRTRALIPTGIDAHFTYLKRLVAPGFARRGIRVISKVIGGGTAAYALLGVRKEAYYAVQYVELGTAKMAAQPWLRPAFAQSKHPMIRALGRDINNWILDVARRKGGARRAQLNANAGAFVGAFSDE